MVVDIKKYEEEAKIRHVEDIVKNPLNVMRIQFSESFLNPEVRNLITVDYIKEVHAKLEKLFQKQEGGAELFARHQENFEHFLKTGEPKTPLNLETEESMFYWGTVLTLLAVHPEMQKDWDEKHRFTDITKSTLWKRIEKSSYMQINLQKHAYIVSRCASEPNAKMVYGSPFGYPNIGYCCATNPKTNEKVIYDDMLWTLLTGTDASATAIGHEIAHSQGTQFHQTPRMKEIEKERDEAQKQLEDALKRNNKDEAAKLTRKIMQLNLEYQMRYRFFDELENMFANRYAVTRGGDYDRAHLNELETAINVGEKFFEAKTIKEMREKLKKDPEARIQHVKDIARNSFFCNNGLVEEDIPDWHKVGLFPELLDGKHPDGEMMSALECFREIRRICNEFEKKQPSQELENLSPQLYKDSMTRLSGERMELVDEFFDMFVAHHLEELYKMQNQELEQMLNSLQQQAQQQQQQNQPQQGQPQQGQPQSGQPQSGEGKEGEGKEGEGKEGEGKEGEGKEGEGKEGEGKEGEGKEGEGKEGEGKEGEGKEGEGKEGEGKEGEGKEGEGKEGEGKEGEGKEGEGKEGEGKEGEGKEGEGKEGEGKEGEGKEGEGKEGEGKEGEGKEGEGKEGEGKEGEGKEGEGKEGEGKEGEGKEGEGKEGEGKEGEGKEGEGKEGEGKEGEEKDGSKTGEGKDGKPSNQPHPGDDPNGDRSWQDSLPKPEDMQLPNVKPKNPLEGKTDEEIKEMLEKASSVADLKQDYEETHQEEIEEHARKEKEFREARGEHDGPRQRKRTSGGNVFEGAQQRHIEAELISLEDMMPPSNRSAIEYRNGNYNDYQKYVAELTSEIERAKKFIEEIILERKLEGVERGRESRRPVRTLTPGQLQKQRAIDLRRKISRGEQVTLRDFERFDKKRKCKDIELAQEVEVSSTNIVIVMDSSGSMNGQPFENAIKIACILYEAAREFKEVSLFVYAMGDPEPVTLAHPDMSTKQISEMLDAARKLDGHGCADRLIPSVIKALSDITKEIEHKPSQKGSFTHIFSITDGGNNDYSGYDGYNVNDILGKMIRDNPQITFDSLFICNYEEEGNYTQPLIRELQEEGITQMDYVNVTSGDVIPEKIVEILKKRMRHSGKDKKGKDLKPRTNGQDKRSMEGVIKEVYGAMKR